MEDPADLRQAERKFGMEVGGSTHEIGRKEAFFSVKKKIWCYSEIAGGRRKEMKRTKCDLCHAAAWKQVTLTELAGNAVCLYQRIRWGERKEYGRAGGTAWNATVKCSHCGMPVGQDEDVTKLSSLFYQNPISLSA